MREQIVIIGGGGHAKVVIDVIKIENKITIYGIVDPYVPVGTPIMGVKVIGGDHMLKKLFKKGISAAFIGVGSVKDCKVRKKIYDNLKKIGFWLPVIKHPRSIIANDVKCQEGVFIAAGVVINSATRIGRNAIINTSVSIDHDCTVGDFVHIAPGVTLSGGVKVGDGSHIGAGATVIQGITIGKGCLVAAGTTLCHNISDNERYYGSRAIGAHDKE